MFLFATKAKSVDSVPSFSEKPEEKIDRVEIDENFWNWGCFKIELLI